MERMKPNFFALAMSLSSDHANRLNHDPIPYLYKALRDASRPIKTIEMLFIVTQDVS